MALTGGRSEEVERKIADLLKKPVQTIYPEFYTPDGIRIRKRGKAISQRRQGLVEKAGAVRHV